MTTLIVALASFVSLATAAWIRFAPVAEEIEADRSARRATTHRTDGGFQ